MPHKQYVLNANTVSVSEQKVFVSVLENGQKFLTNIYGNMVNTATGDSYNIITALCELCDDYVKNVERVWVKY